MLFSTVVAETQAVFSYMFEFEGPKLTSGFELMDRIATFCKCFLEIHVKSPNREL